MVRGGTAAATDDRQAVTINVVVQNGGEIVRTEGITGPLPRDLGQASVRHAHDRYLCSAGQGTQVLGHLGGSGGAVEADGVGAERFQHRQCCTGLRPHEHGSGGLDGEVDENRQVDLARGGGTMSAYDCGASLQEVLAGLDLDTVGARVNHGLDDLLVDIADGGETNLAKGR